MGKTTFEQPPLIEVSFGLFFKQPENFRAAHFGRFWSKLKSDFPTVEDRVAVGNIQGRWLTRADAFPLPRVWYEHNDHHLLIQLQPDRFYLNWRKLADGKYPRYETLQSQCFEYFERYRAFLHEEGLGAPELAGTELVYVNRVEFNDAWTSFSEVGKVFPHLGWNTEPRFLRAPSAVAWHGMFELDAMRLDVDIKSARDPDDAEKRFVQMELRAASQEESSPPKDLKQWFDGANETIVAAFIDLTSKDFQSDHWKHVAS
jgi:uncharacterized protein (TIGR04255 family)